ncbi:MAG: FAD-dependent oxidoreductase, partial [Bryobacterales bacterium]|nr:FAD-dependent oxidoreductase [Bryobacterales bacterium]
MFHFVFGMMARGETTLPLAGMEAIPLQLASALPRACVRTGARCVRWEDGRATLGDGREIRFRHGVLATEATTTAKLLGLPAPLPPRATTCLYFAASKSPLERPAICLNGEGKGMVNHIAVPSDVSPRYAPPGASLISVSLIGEAALPESALADQVRAELQGWFGKQVGAWRYLRSYRIPFAQPNQDAGAFTHPQTLRASRGAWLCGDHLTDASIDGALRSGRQTAEAILDA